MHVSPCIAAIAALLFAPLSLARGPDPVVIESGATPEQWKVITAEGVTLKHEQVKDAAGRACIRVEFAFISGGGYGILQRDVGLDLPDNYEFAFDLRAPAGTPRNNLELKLLDEKGENVWWVNRRNFSFPTDWTTLRSRRRHFEFAWGPSGGLPFSQAAKIEIVIASATGGKGEFFMDDVTFRPLPAPRAIPTNPVTVRDAEGITLDLGSACELDGVIITGPRPRGNAAPVGFSVSISDDGATFRPVATSPPLAGPPAGPSASAIAHAPDLQARFVRVASTAPKSPVPPLPPDITVVPLPGGTVPDGNALVTLLASRAPRGLYPRWALREQTYWTVLGLPERAEESLLSEDGALELRTRGCSIEPVILTNQGALTWARGAPRHTLARNAHPVANIEREAEGLTLTITAAAAEVSSTPVALAEYRIKNTSAQAQRGELVIMVRPFQVNPPWQALNILGGIAPAATARVTSPRRVDLDAHGPVFFSAGVRASCTTVERFAADPAAPGDRESSSPHGLAMGTGRLPFALAPGEELTAFALAPQGTWTDEQAEAWLDAPASADARTARELLNAVTARWAERAQNAPQIDLGPDPLAQRIMATMASQLDAIAVNADGPAVQPGSRCYERSWARDGAMTSVTLCAFGRPEAARRWIEWYFAKQFESGKVPCVVDLRGPDPVDEHDSTGQLIYALAEYHRFTGDLALVRTLYPRVVRAVEYLEGLRNLRLTAEFAEGAPPRKEPGKPPVPASAFRGILPESISHEGYSAKPMHSYWDDFFALRGLKDAAYLAGVMGDAPGATRYADLARAFRASLLASIKGAMAAHAIDYIPGCVELGDFDATSTAVAVSPCAEQVFLPAAPLAATFDKWWTFFTARRDGQQSWGDYTPYELRTVGVMVELARKDQALEMLRWYFEFQRPQGWNHWAEVVTSDPRQPRFIGDMPHTWVGSDYLRSVRTMLAFERNDPDGETLVLLAGIPAPWLAGKGISATALPTHHGPLTITARRRDDAAVEVQVTRAPEPGAAQAKRAAPRIEVVNPRGSGARRVTINAAPADLTGAGDRVTLQSLPATVVFEHPE